MRQLILLATPTPNPAGAGKTTPGVLSPRPALAEAKAAGKWLREHGAHPDRGAVLAHDAHAPDLGRGRCRTG